MRYAVTLTALATFALATSGSVLPRQAAAQQGAVKLIAPVYPGAIPVSHQDDEDDRRNMARRWEWRLDGALFPYATRLFISKDSLETVRAYYDKEVGEMQKGSLSYLRMSQLAMPEENLRPGPYVFAHTLGWDENTLIGVELRALEPKEERAPTKYDAVGPIFDRLMAGHLTGQATGAQFDALVEEYKHLAWMFYPLTDERDQSERRLTMDEVVVNECEKQAAGGMSPQEIEAKREELGAEIQQLAMQGKNQELRAKMQELQGLNEQAVGAGGMDTWDTWVDCLKKMEAEGYRTLISIHLQP